MNKIESGAWRYLGLSAICFALTALYPANLEAKCKPGKALAPGDHVFNLDFEGNSRTFTVHVPPKYDGSTPTAVVFDLHGSYGTGPSQLSTSGFATVSDMNNFLVVAPTGYMNFWNGDIAFGAAYEMKINDVGFMKAVVEYLDGIANINRGKVYSTGLSNGAAMSNTLGCQAADTFAGIAPVSDPLDIGLATCKPAQPISVLGFHGYSDEFVPYEGGAGSGPMLPTPFPSIPDTLKAWAKIMECTGEPEVIPFGGKNKCEIYRECGGDAQVGYCSLEGGHGLYSQGALNIADYAWKFFDRFSLPLPDADGDQIGDEDDNCVYVANPDQADANGNCVGDVCECKTPADCDDGKFCNGSEACTNGVCDRGAAACQASQKCAEDLKQCVEASKESDAGAAAAAAGSRAGQAGDMPRGSAGTQAVATEPVDAGNPVSQGPAGSSAQSDPSAIGSRSDSTVAQEPPPEAKSGCGCYALGGAGETAPLRGLVSLLGIGLVLSWKTRRRRNHRSSHTPNKGGASIRRR